MSDRRLRLLGLPLAVLVVACSSSAPPPSATLTGSAGTSSPTGPDATPGRTPRASKSLKPGRSVQPTLPPEPTPTPVPTPTLEPISGLEGLVGSDGRFTVLLLGSDARPGLSGERTDMIMVATIDPATGRLATVSLPRDMEGVPIGDGQTYHGKITGLFQDYELHGASRQEALRKTKDALAYAFGIEIDHYALIKFPGVVSLIDRIGGVDIQLKARFEDPTAHITTNGRRGLHLRAGLIHMNGKLALAFARSRHTTTDFDRARRQQLIISATIQKVRDAGVDALPALADFAISQIETDLPLSAAPAVFALGQRADLSHRKGVVLEPSRYAANGSVLYSFFMKVDAVRALFDRIFAPAG